MHHFRVADLAASRTKSGTTRSSGGHPKSLREEALAPGRIGAGPYSAIFRVTLACDTEFKCAIERRDLISFDGPLPAVGTDMGG